MRFHLSIFALWILTLAAACAADSPAAPSRDGGDAVSPLPDAADVAAPPDALARDSHEAETEAPDAAAITPDANLPEVPPFTRPPRGEPVSADAVAAATALYLEVLRETRWLEVVAERAHGWPRSDPAGRFWYGTWWSGVRIRKEEGRVTYVHAPDGADNNGLRTAPILDGVCFAHTLWGGQTELLRTLVRGFESWGLAMQRDGVADLGVMLARAHYPESITAEDHGRTIHIDYDAVRPGAEWERDGDPPSIFVHNPANPVWGDIWVKNIRSKDDIGHMLQALAYLTGCVGAEDGALAADLARVMALYEAWSRRVEDDGWRIITVDRDWQPYFPVGELAFFLMPAKMECVLALAVRLMGRGDEGALGCGDGITPVSEFWSLKNDFHQIQRSFQQAAAVLAAVRGQPVTRDLMLRGLAWRLDKIFDAREAGLDPAGPHDQDLAELVVMSANVGVPLTAREVRFLHDRIAEAHESYLDEARLVHYRVFDPATPDGEYVFTPDGRGFFWRTLALALGTCASPFASPHSEPVLDCQELHRPSRPN
jgi:hypothetical protein